MIWPPGAPDGFVWTRENSDPRVPLVEFDGDDLIWPPDDDPDRSTTGADPLTAEPGRYAHPLLVEPPSTPTGEDDA